MSEPEYRVETLPGSFETLGLVLDLLSRHAPFADASLATMVPTIRRQLKRGRQVAALAPNGDLIAYAGWVPTLQASAELWVEDRGPLKILEKDADAVALTIVVSSAPAVTRELLRRVRNICGDKKWYFKRSYDGQLRNNRKQMLVDRHPGAISFAG
jgi:hypothetical protein